MLTADLVQASVRRGVVRPKYIQDDDADNLALAEALISIFESGQGKSRGQLDSELQEFSGTGTAFILHRGLAKLLLDRCEFETDAPVKPAELRRTVFEEAAELYRRQLLPFDREVAIRQAEERMGLAEGLVEPNLFADLKDEQILNNFKGYSAERLLCRYNVALAQAVLLRATRLEIQIAGQSPARYREVFRKIRFFQLLHQVEGDLAAGYHIVLDGPLSLFKSSQRYGLQMASFVPTLLHCDDWELNATVLWGKKRRELAFRLSPRDGLRPHTRLTGQWQPGEIAWLLEQFPKLESDWSISGDTELIDLGGKGVLVPDFVFSHGPTGRKVFMEIFGFWRKGAVASRIELLRGHGPANLILALSKDLYAGEEALSDLPGEVYVFRSTPIAREVLGLLGKWETEGGE